MWEAGCNESVPCAQRKKQAQPVAAWPATMMASGSSRQSISSMTCGGTGTQPAAHSRMPAQQAYRQPGLTGGSFLSSCGSWSAPHPAASRRQPTTQGPHWRLGYPHSPHGTCFRHAARRLPLQILDDKAFCTDMAAMNSEYLEAHPQTEQLSRGQRWVHRWLKRRIRLFASDRVLAAAKARRQALAALKADSRAAQTQHEAHQAGAAALLRWRQAHLFFNGMEKAYMSINHCQSQAFQQSWQTDKANQGHRMRNAVKCGVA